MTLAVRAARVDDVDLAVPMLRASMGGLGNYLFQNLSRTPNEYLGQSYRERGHRFSWSVSFVGDTGNEPAAFMLSYPGRELDALQIAFLRKFWSLFGWSETWRLLGRARHLLNAPEAKKDEYYISNIGVLPDRRGRGYGTQLMAFAEFEAKRARLARCSLAVDVTNVGAIRLYQRLGYRIVYTRKFDGALAKQESGYHRMVKELS